MLNHCVSEIFGLYSQSPYGSHTIDIFFRNATRVDLMWGAFSLDSLKSNNRSKRGKGTRGRVHDQLPVLKNWDKFLRVDQNIVALFETT